MDGIDGGQSSAPASVVVVPSATSDVQAATGDGVGEGAPPAPLTDFSHLTARVNLTGGNRSGLTGYRSNRSGPVPVPAGTQPAKI